MSEHYYILYDISIFDKKGDYACLKAYKKSKYLVKGIKSYSYLKNISKVTGNIGMKGVNLVNLGQIF